MNSGPTLQSGVGWQTRWVRSFVVLAFLLPVLVFVYWSTARGMVLMWRTSTFSHGFVVAPISMYLIWMRRDRLRKLTPKPNGWSLVVIALLGIGWLVAHIATVGIGEQFCFVVMVIACVWGVLGTEVTRSLAMPLAFLLFAVPAGESVIPKLQDFSAWFAVRMLDLSGVPVLLEGRFITVPSGKWEVAEACSGIRYLTSSVAVGFLFAGLMYQTWIRRVGFFLASIVVPILANAIRVFGIVLVAYVSGNRLAVGVDHLLYGWLFFTIVMLLLFAVGGRWRERGLSLTEVSPAQKNDGPESGPHINSTSAPTRLFAFGGLLLITAAVAPLSAKVVWGKQVDPAQHPLMLPTTSLAVQNTCSEAFNWKPTFVSPSSELVRCYDVRNRTVELYVA
jgi:exosortase A